MRERMEKEIKEIGKMIGRSSRLIFGVCAIISSVVAIFGMNALPVMAAEDVEKDRFAGLFLWQKVNSNSLFDTY